MLMVSGRRKTANSTVTVPLTFSLFYSTIIPIIRENEFGAFYAQK
jgi:hypothetical protein